MNTFKIQVKLIGDQLPFDILINRDDINEAWKIWENHVFSINKFFLIYGNDDVFVFRKKKVESMEIVKLKD